MRVKYGSGFIYKGFYRPRLLVISEHHRRQGLASGLLTAQIHEAFAQGMLVGYHAGGATDDIHAMLMKLVFYPANASFPHMQGSNGEPCGECLFSQNY